ncbi:MAG: PSD1 and planctomycete cytochrome C domain-containing protein [Planctomycetales bacterium]
MDALKDWLLDRPNDTARPEIGRAVRWAALVMAALLGLAPQTGRGEAPRVRFNRDIRPILSEHCFACHGPDARHRRASLRLDTEAGIKAELESGMHGVVPGNPDASELLVRIVSEDDSERMPPPETGKRLTGEQTELIKQWIAKGAPWEGHWSWQPIGRPSPPSIPPDDGSRISPSHPIDAFILKSLAAQGLSPAAEADKAILIRRVFLDLLGLPPTSAEVELFLEDDATDAYERLVDRLLASPAFGERLAIVWLDLVRFADSVGYFADQTVRMSPYRDYVIRSLNANKPFDRFTVEQLAGDLLPDATLETRIAAGYNRLGRVSTESGVQEKEYLTRYAADRVRNAGTTWLGLTLGCCECHDHKYDPLSTRDFYQLEAFFADIKERGVYDKDTPTGIDFGPSLALGTPAQQRELDELTEKIDRKQRDLEQLQRQYVEGGADRRREISDWERALKRSEEWKVLQPLSVVSSGKARCRVLPDKSILVSGARPETDTYTFKARSPLRSLTALRLEVLPDPSLRNQGPGRGADGNFVLTGLTLSISSPNSPTPREVPFRAASATFEQTDAPGGMVSRVWSAALAIQPDPRRPDLGWAVTDRLGVPHHAVFETAQDVSCGPDGELTFVLRHNHGDARTLGRFRIFVTQGRRPVEVFGYRLPEPIRGVLEEPAWQRSESQRKELAEYFAAQVTAAGEALRKELDVLRDRRGRLIADIPSVLVVETVEPRPIRILPRGNWQDDSGEIVSPSLPASLARPRSNSGRLTRLDLAQWIVSPDNPLTARVLVNRLWKLYFGAGLSRKLDDLGSQGDWPTHPELLDWLAGRLIDSGWDLKQAIRQIVTSQTYRQSATGSELARERDPENRWLSHQSRFRLEAELVRDGALAVSGLLAAQVGGLSVKPYQPQGYWDLLSKPPRVWEESEGAGVYRRGLYTHWQRQYLHPMLMAFDAPSREECAADRPRSNTPMQALVLLNDPTFVEAAKVLAERAVREAGSPDHRIDWLYREILARPPQPLERAVLANLVEAMEATYRLDPASAAELLTVGRATPAAQADAVELAAWANAARTLLNLHDMVTRP